MKKYSRILIIANLILLLGYFNWSVYKKEQTLKDGQLILLQLAPVDPRSLMQGDYMRLSYKEASSDLLDEQTDTRGYAIYNPQIQISAESETKRSIFREKDKTKRSKKESAQHSKSRNKSFVMTSVSAL